MIVIGNLISKFKPNKGYDVKLISPTSVIIYPPKDSVGRLSEKIYAPIEPNHFKTNYIGNPYLPMNIYIAGASYKGIPLVPGDEIGIFDGDLCVGAAVVEKQINEYNVLAVTASMNRGKNSSPSTWLPSRKCELDKPRLPLADMAVMRRPWSAVAF